MSKTVFLGVEGSGKTTLTMALARAFESHKNEGWYLKPLSRDSFRFLKTLPDSLDGSFPSQTADLRELRWQAEYEGNDLGEIAILDYPGEIYRLAFLDEKDERDPEAFRQKVANNKLEIDALLGAIKEADDVFVLFNLSDGMDLRGNPRNLDTVWVTNECLKLLKRLESKPRIRLVFTQVDRYRDSGLDLAAFSPKSIDLIGHDHSDIPWSLVSVIDPPTSKYGIDGIVRLFMVAPLKRFLDLKMPIDLANINVNKLICDAWDYDVSKSGTVGIPKNYFEKIDSSVAVLETICTKEDWVMLEIVKPYWGSQTQDWKILAKLIREIANKPIKDVNLQVDFNVFMSQWGKDLARRIVERFEGLKKAVVSERQVWISLFVVLCVVALLALVIGIVVATQGAK